MTSTGSCTLGFTLPVIHTHLSRIHHILDVRNGERCFSNIRSHHTHTYSFWRWLEHLQVGQNGELEKNYGRNTTVLSVIGTSKWQYSSTTTWRFWQKMRFLHITWVEYCQSVDLAISEHLPNFINSSHHYPTEWMLSVSHQITESANQKLFMSDRDSRTNSIACGSGARKCRLAGISLLQELYAWPHIECQLCVHQICCR